MVFIHTPTSPIIESRGLRRRASLSQRDVALQVGIDFTYLSKLENDHGEAPGEATIRRLAAVLHADSEALLALAGKGPRPENGAKPSATSWVTPPSA
ncbi:XRE family transcriptional regulator [Lacticaseibacillus rhamnosus]